MSQQVKNLRQRRTQKLLQNALIELIEEESFEKLSVQALTERAMVSRAAFYRNYKDKYDLVEQIFADAMENLFNSLSQPSVDHPPQDLIWFFEHFQEHERLYSALLGRHGSHWFVLKMRAILIDFLKENQNLPLWQLSPNQSIYPETDDFVPNIVATMIVEAITWWLEEGRPYTSQEIATRCASLVSTIFKETSNWS